VRDVLPDLLHHSITDMMKGAGNLRQPATVVQARIERFAEKNGMTVADVRARLLAKYAFPEERVDAVLEGRALDGEVAAAVCVLLNLYPEQLVVHKLEDAEEVTYLPPPQDQPDPTTCSDWSQPFALLCVTRASHHDSSPIKTPSQHPQDDVPSGQFATHARRGRLHPTPPWRAYFYVAGLHIPLQPRIGGY
jgi:hypothetical protein